MYQHILIPTDGSELATKGLVQGLALAKALGAKVSVLTVTEPLPSLALAAALRSGAKDPFGDYNRQMDDQVAELSKTVQQQAVEAGVPVELIHEDNAYPAAAIVRVAKDKGCDLIVMSSHGRRGVTKLLLGSQTSEVLVNATVPVHVVR